MHACIQVIEALHTLQSTDLRLSTVDYGNALWTCVHSPPAEQCISVETGFGRTPHLSVSCYSDTLSYIVDLRRWMNNFRFIKITMTKFTRTLYFTWYTAHE